MNPILNKEQIEAIIPHRYEFLLIDEVLSLEPGISCLARKYVKPDDFYFRGHFPNNPVMPGVLQLEALAQAGAVAILSLEANKGKTAYFGGINNVKFKKMVLPNSILDLGVEIIKSKGPVGVGSAKATINGEIVVSAELTFIVK